MLWYIGHFMRKNSLKRTKMLNLPVIIEKKMQLCYNGITGSI